MDEPNPYHVMDREYRIRSYSDHWVRALVESVESGLSKPVFNVGLSTDSTFAEVFRLYQRLGLPLSSRIKSLRYGESILVRLNEAIMDDVEKKHTNGPYQYLRDLDNGLVALLDSYQGPAEVIVSGPGGSEFEGLAITYRVDVMGKPEESGLQRELDYKDRTIVIPRLDQILGMSPILLTKQQKINIIDWLKRELKLDV